jgi:hypothetical protein
VASGPGGTCNGSVTVKVPKDMSPKTVTGDGGVLYDSIH